MVAKTGDDVAATGAKKADNLTPTTSVVAKTGDDVAATGAKKADKPNAKQRAKAKMRGYFSNLNKGNYWDTDLSSVAQKYGSF